MSTLDELIDNLFIELAAQEQAYTTADNVVRTASDRVYAAQEAIPPAYTEFVGGHLISVLEK